MIESSNTPAAVRQGFDAERFEDFCAFARENPAEVRLGFEATGVAEDRAVHTLATTGPYSLGGRRIDRLARRYSHHFGAHREVEEALGFVDPTDREEVIEVALAALSACINAVVSVAAARRGLDVDGLRTDARIEWDPAVFLQLEDPERDGEPVDQFGVLGITLSIDGDGLRPDDVAFLERTVKRSAVFNLMALPHEHEIAVRTGRAGAPGPDGSR